MPGYGGNQFRVTLVLNVLEKKRDLEPNSLEKEKFLTMIGALQVEIKDFEDKLDETYDAIEESLSILVIRNIVEMPGRNNYATN